MSTVPVFAPDGTLGDIPAEKLMDAKKAGFIPGVTMKTADGQTGVVPSTRVQEATKSGMQIVPLGDQETQHAGFWHAVATDLGGMAKGLATTAVNALPGNELIPDSVRNEAGIGPARDVIGEGEQMAADYQKRKAAGYSMPYRVAAPVAEAAGVNVKEMEESAAQGDVAGVAGHAAVPLATTAAAIGLTKGAPAISNVAQAAAERAATAARDITPKQAAQVAGAGTGAIAAHGWGAYWGNKLGQVAEVILGKERANTPIFQKATSLDNAADALAQVIANDRAADAARAANAASDFQAQSAQAKERLTEAVQPQSTTGKELGLVRSTGAKPASETGEALTTQPQATDLTSKPKAASSPRFTVQDRVAAQSLLEDALKQHTGDVVDRAIPPSGNTYGANLTTKARVEFYLSRGDVANAEASLDQGASKVPGYTASERPGPVPTVDDIRKAVKSGNYAPEKPTAINPGMSADSLEDHAIQQEMNWNLQRHGWSADSEARREFIARNSTGMTKDELITRAGGAPAPETPVKYTKTPGVKGYGKTPPAQGSSTEDLTDILQKSLDEARKRQQGQ